jgi:hypothetical protein
VKTRNHFERLSTSAGLLVLGVGFVSLGALSFAKRDLVDAESGFLLNSAYPIIGSLISILLGFAFLAIALLFIATPFKEEKAPTKTARALNAQSKRIAGDTIYSAAHSRHGDWSGPGIACRKHEVPRERAVLVSNGSDL